MHDVAIIGGGISGLTALHFTRRQHPDHKVVLFERDNRLGGTIGTDNVDGYSFDWGPNGFLDREPLTLQLCDQLGLTEQLERAGESVSNRFILRKGRLRKVPMKPPAFLTSDILSLKGRLRVMCELFSAARPEGVDESIYDFAKRRIGRDAADYLVQPMVSGIYGGMAERLSLKACFSIMYEMESEYGSLLKAMIAKARKAKAEGKDGGGPGGPGGWLTSFEGGLYTIIERFEATYREFIQQDKQVTSLAKDGEHYKLEFSDGSFETAANVILAVPSYVAAEIVSGLSAELSDALGSIAYAPIAVICLGYDTTAVRTKVDGFGFLVPKREGKRILGSIWTSSIFKDRVPPGKVQLRTMIGGDGDHDALNLNDSDLIALVTRELDDIMGLDGDPEMVRIFRWVEGIPQYHIGHGDKITRMEQALDALGHLSVTGNAYYGIGLNDCIKQSHKVVADL